MAYNEHLATRVADVLASELDVVEKKMFGGVAFMVNGKMCVGVVKDELMARLDPNVYEYALRRKGCHEMRFTGKPMKGFVFVGQEGMKTKKDLQYWVDLALEYNRVAKASPRSKRS